MDYKISFSKMDQLGRQANLNRCSVCLAQMRKQALDLKNKGISEVKKDLLDKVALKEIF